MIFGDVMRRHRIVADGPFYKHPEAREGRLP
jgi:hypothetical protein